MAIAALSRGSVSAQISSFERSVDAACARVVRNAARRIRKAVVRELLSGKVDPQKPGRTKKQRAEWNAQNPGAPLAKRSGNMIRMLKFTPRKTAAGWDLECESLAPYSELYEKKGRYPFTRICEREWEVAEEELRLAIEVLTRNQTSGLGSAVVEDAPSVFAGYVDADTGVSAERYFFSRRLRISAGAKTRRELLTLSRRGFR